AGCTGPVRGARWDRAASIAHTARANLACARQSRSVRVVSDHTGAKLVRLLRRPLPNPRGAGRTPVGGRAARTADGPSPDRTNAAPSLDAQRRTEHASH